MTLAAEGGEWQVSGPTAWAALPTAQPSKDNPDWQAVGDVMLCSMPDEPEMGKLEELRPMPGAALSGKERAASGIVGLALLITGGWATFKADGEAGTAVLLVMGAALFLMGVQGTPLIRIGGDNASIELERRIGAQRVVQEVADKNGPEAARDVADAFQIVDPGLRRTLASQSALLYELAVRDALERLGVKFLGVEVFDYGRLADVALRTSNGAIVPIEIKYSHSKRMIFAQIVETHKKWAKASTLGNGVGLVVSNSPLSNAASELLKGLDLPKMRFVVWRGSEDDNMLRESLNMFE